MQMAAVMAAKLSAYPPKGANSKVTHPVAPITGEIGVL
jgi:hypothetical protein